MSSKYNMGVPIPPDVDICGSCIHYQGLKLFPIDEDMEEDARNVCKAFPEGIPEVIISGKSKHRKPLKGQRNDIVFERKH
jgi:hypothetical protein